MEHQQQSTHIISIRAQRATCILMGLDFLTMLLSLPIIVVGFWLAFRHHIDCLKFLEGPIIFIGVALFLVSLVGMVGIIRLKKILVWAYLGLLFLLILLLLCFTLFAFFVTSGGGGHRVRGAVFQEYRLGDFSQWFQDQTTDPNKWVDMELCLQDGKICAGLDQNYPNLLQFNNAELSPVQSGCCKPPSACGFTFVTPTRWVNTTSATATGDCGRWDNDAYELCYECSSCRAGLLQNVKQDWSKVAKVCLVVLILLALVCFITWFTFMRVLWDNIFTHIPHTNPGYSYPKL